MKSPKAFRTITHKNLEDYKHHEKKPPTSVLEDLKDNPWHYQNNLKYQTLKPSRGLPIRDQEKKDFQNYIAKKAQYFSIPEVRSEDTLLSFLIIIQTQIYKLFQDVEKERLAKEKKNEEKNLWKTKLKGTEYFYTFNKDIKKESQTDRYKVLFYKTFLSKIYPIYFF